MYNVTLTFRKSTDGQCKVSRTLRLIFNTYEGVMEFLDSNRFTLCSPGEVLAEINIDLHMAAECNG